MSDISRQARRAMRAKAHRMAMGSEGKLDASDFTPAEPLNTTIKTGMRPVSRSAFKAGGKVQGKDSTKHAGKTPRRAKGTDLTINSIVNRNVKDANEERPGGKAHVGGYKRGGKADGGPTAESYVPTDRMNFSGAQSRMSKAAGLKTGGKAWEGSPKDEAEDKKLQKKYHIPSKDFEKSAVDKKHDKQHSMKGLKTGGHAKGCTCKMCRGGYAIGGSMSVSDGSLEGTRPTGGRLAKKSGGGNWIGDAIKHPGALHRELHVPEGDKIPAKKMAEAAHSKNPHTRRQAALAETLGRMHKKGGGGIADLELATGGRAKRKSGNTDINIIISAGQKPQPAMPPMPDAGQVMPPPMAAPKPPMMSPAAPAGLPAGLPPGIGAPPMMRKSGGRVRTGNKGYYDMDGGAGSGLGRLQKID